MKSRPNINLNVLKQLRFSEGERIEINSPSGNQLFEVRKDQDGEPRRHLVKKSTGEVKATGSSIKITDKITRVK